MSDKKEGVVKRFFKSIGGYAKTHPWKTAAFVGVAALGLLIIAGGIVLIATSPASFGGGAAVGVPLVAVGGGLAGGAIMIAGGLVLTGTATGLFWRSSRNDKTRKDVVKNLNLVMNDLSSDHGIGQGLKIPQKSAGSRKAHKDRDKIDRDKIVKENTSINRSNLFAGKKQKEEEVKNGPDLSKVDDLYTGPK